MIFNVKGHIEQIVNGAKTQTRRDSGKYEVNKTYAIQPGRGKFADPRGRILITYKFIEEANISDIYEGNIDGMISRQDALEEGGYTPEYYEMLYEDIHPFWRTRWVYKFKFIPSLRPSITEEKK